MASTTTNKKEIKWRLLLKIVIAVITAVIDTISEDDSESNIA